MKTTTLKAKERVSKGKKARAKAENNIPAVIYGNDFEPQTLWVDATDFARVFSQAGTNTVISLEIEKQKPVNVLVYDFQTDPVTDVFTHIDFYVVNMKEKVEAEIPLVFVNEAPAVKELGGTLVKSFDVLNVRALPADLPHEIVVDLSKLETFADHITVSDIEIGKNVEAVQEQDAIIVSVAAPRSEDEIVALDEEVDADVSNIEGVAEETTEDASAGDSGTEEKKENA